MHERKKKGGQRKDKKMERMREDVQQRKDNAGDARPTTDQKDVVTYKPGSGGDKNQDPTNIRSMRGTR